MKKNWQNICRSTTLAVCLLAAVTCAKTQPPSHTKQPYLEPHRPQYHFSPPKGWMNDPNGLVYFEGEYHLFYQHYPDGNTWGPMHWGHAISTDLVHWQHYPIALFPDSLGYIFSGSIVIDWPNSSGFGKHGQPPMVAIFTYHDMEGEKAGRTDYQNQAVAYSNDKGRTWIKYSNNPVLHNPGVKDFRDPKVMWHGASKHWIMALAVKDKISFYRSPNLLQWQHCSDFSAAWAAHGEFWECPDLFPLHTTNGVEKWVLLVSINPGGPHGGSATQYFVGHFDGKQFVPETTQIKWLDYGADNYAGVTFSDVPARDGRRLFMGWMSNWLYAQQVPTEIWRSAMTLPRWLRLQQQGNDYTLCSEPIKELNALRVSTTQATTNRIALASACTELEIDSLSSDFRLVLSNEAQEKVILEKKGNQLSFDRSQSGITQFSEAFGRLHTVPLAHSAIRHLKIYIDWSSIAFIFNHGELNITELVFPTLPYTLLETSGVASPITMHALRSIWKSE